MLPQTTEYALRAVVWMASYPETPQTSDQMAQATHVPPRYLYKVLQSLTHGGLVRSQPGPHGGYSLTRSPDEITILDVVNIVAPIQRIRTCPLGLESHGMNLCPLHKELDQAYARIETAFARVSVGQLLRKRCDSVPLCEG